jgi:DNA repair exonuclease SbcCD ATPase subunit
MLRLLSVNPTGFASYGICETVQIDQQGLVNLLGRNLDKDNSSNGSGKTSLFNVVTACLFGKVESYVAGSLQVNDALVNEVLGLGMCIRTEWVNTNGQHWRVTLSRKWEGATPYPNDSKLWPFRGTDIYLEQEVSGAWVDRRKAEMPKTRHEVLAAVGISYERFLSTSYLTQSSGGLAFIRGTNAQQMSGIFESLGLRTWELVLAELKTKRDYAKSRKEASASALAGVRTAIDHVKKSASLLSDEQEASLSRERAGCVQAKATADQKLAEISDRISQLLKKKALSDANINPFDSELGNVRSQLRTLRSNPKQDIGIFQLQAEISAIASKVASTRTEIQSVTTTKVCKTCGQTIKTSDHLLSSLMSALSTAESDKLSLESKLKQLTELRESERQLEIASLEKQELQLQASSTTWLASKTIDDPGPEIVVLQQESTQVIGVLSLANQRIGAIDSSLKMSADGKQKLQQLEFQEAALAAEFTVLERDFLEYEWLYTHSGDKGFKSWKLATCVDRLNSLLAEVLSEIDPSLKVWCQSFRVKAKAGKEVKQEDLIHEFTIFVKDGAKSTVPIELYSGGESSLIAIALMVAQWRLGSEVGGGTNFLALDEVASALDARASQLVANFIESMKAHGKTVVMISHNNLIDVIDFDHKWVVTKQHDISTIEVIGGGK